MIDKDTLGGRITILRNAKQLSQKSLAEQLGVSTTAICKWEQNACSPTRSNLIALCHFFSTSASWIVMGMEQGPGLGGRGSSLRGPLVTGLGTPALGLRLGRQQEHGSGYPERESHRGANSGPCHREALERR